jgi:hypothetical protein
MRLPQGCTTENSLLLLLEANEAISNSLYRTCCHFSLFVCATLSWEFWDFKIVAVDHYRLWTIFHREEFCGLHLSRKCIRSSFIKPILYLSAVPLLLLLLWFFLIFKILIVCNINIFVFISSRRIMAGAIEFMKFFYFLSFLVCVCSISSLLVLML